VAVEAAVGSVLRLTATAATGAACRLESPDALAEAVKHPLLTETLVEQFGRLGNTPYQLRRLEAKLDGRAMVPLSVLGKLRREMLDQLQAAAAQPPFRLIAEESALAVLRAEGSGFRVPGSDSHNHQSSIRNQKSLAPRPSSPVPCLHVLCRSMEQIEAALGCGVSSVIADFQDLEHCGEAVRAAHAAGATILLATPRIHKPGETVHRNVSPLPLGEGQGVRASDVFESLANHRPDGLLVRNLAGLSFCRRTGLPAVADFSLNAANDLTVRWLHDQGARRVTAAYDLSRRQLLDLAAAVPPEWLEVVVHRHTPLFHAEYCLFCRTFSQGNNRTDCGQPCRRHTLRLRDRLGVEHPVLADSQCRNTVFHADAENLADAVPGLRERGIRHFRVELATEGNRQEVRRAVAAQQRLVGGPSGGP
jgi:putative protease